MTTNAIGGVSQNPVQVSSYTRNSSATSIQNNNNIADSAYFTTPAQEPTPSEIVVENVTSIPDAPGFTKIAAAMYFTAAQSTAIRSAAANTAAAFGLNQTIEADRAVKHQLSLSSLTKPRTTRTINEIIIPP